MLRREFLAAAAASAGLAKGKKLPVGLELFSVRNELQKDDVGTVKAVAKLGYDCLEFFSPYTSWSTAKAKEMRALMDSVGIKCLSTHNGVRSFDAENLDKILELNNILGSRMAIMASAGRVEDLSGWKKVADKLNAAADRAKTANLRVGFHNHQTEFKPIEGKMPMEVLALETQKTVIFQLDVGTCVHAGVDPVKWIEKNPGRFASIHCKDWSADPAIGYKALFGEGASPWKKIFAAAEKKGGVEFYLIEQEGSRFSPLETAGKCLEAYRKLRG